MMEPTTALTALSMCIVALVVAVYIAICKIIDQGVVITQQERTINTLNYMLAEKSIHVNEEV